MGKCCVNIFVECSREAVLDLWGSGGDIIFLPLN